MAIELTSPDPVEHLRRLFANNRRFVDDVTRTDPEFFSRRAARQEPHFLFIGCADSRVPIEILTGVVPGEMFVHRNIANQVVAGDMNLLGVLQYAVEVLNVEHVLVCGHFGCGGVMAAMTDTAFGLVDNWLAGVREVHRHHQAELAALPDEESRWNRLVELNVLRQVYQLSRTPTVQNAWKRGRRPLVHGLVYDIRDGLLKELALEVDSDEKAEALLERRSLGVAY